MSSHNCRYCGKKATRWSGVDIYVFDFKTGILVCIGPGYCCDDCDKDNNWIPIGEKRCWSKYEKQKRQRVRSSDILKKLQESGDGQGEDGEVATLDEDGI